MQSKQSRIGQRGATVRNNNALRVAIYDWSKKTGRDEREWWDAARADSLKPGCGHKAVMAWFRKQFSKNK